MANLVKSNREVSPWRDFLDIDRFFMGGLPGRNMNFPAVNISEDEKCYSVEVVAPGFKKEDFKVKVEDDMLTISAETKSENKENDDRKQYSRHPNPRAAEPNAGAGGTWRGTWRVTASSGHARYGEPDCEQRGDAVRCGQR